MAKLPAKFTSQQVDLAGDWLPPQLGGSKIFKVRNPGKEKKIPAHMTNRSKISSDIPAEVAPPKQAEPLVATEPSVEVKGSSGPSAAFSKSESKSESKPESEPESELLVCEESKEGHTEVDGELAYQEGFARGETEGFIKGEQAGHEAGLEAGKQAGIIAAKNEFEAEVADQRAMLKRLVADLTGPSDAADPLASALLPLITQLTEVVLMGELSTEPAHIRRLVDRAIAALPHGSESPRVYVNPSDLEWLKDTIQLDIELLGDAALARGSCRVETSQSQVDADVTHRIRAALCQAWGSEAIPVSDSSGLQEIELALDP